MYKIMASITPRLTENKLSTIRYMYVRIFFD